MCKVQCLEQYTKKVQLVCRKWFSVPATENLWFRGHARSDWMLIPKLYRDHSVKYMEEAGFLEREMMRDFRLKSPAFLEMEPKHGLEQLFIMQHYGLPTRLLDWSESCLTALFFAVSGYDDSYDACVWVMDPWAFNEISRGNRSIYTPEHRFLSEYLPDAGPDCTGRSISARDPVALRPEWNNRRIIAQKGAFTIHGYSIASLEEYLKDKENGRLEKIIIDGHKKLDIMKELYMAGITHLSVFPELTGLCEEIKFRYSDDFFRGNDMFSISE